MRIPACRMDNSTSCRISASTAPGTPVPPMNTAIGSAAPLVSTGGSARATEHSPASNMAIVCLMANLTRGGVGHQHITEIHLDRDAPDRPLEIRQQIAPVFDPNRDPHQSIA